MMWNEFQKSQCGDGASLYTRVPEEGNNSDSPLRGRQNWPPRVPDWGWVYYPCRKGPVQGVCFLIRRRSSENGMKIRSLDAGRHNQDPNWMGCVIN